MTDKFVQVGETGELKASLSVGTNALNLVQLDASAKLPAVAIGSTANLPIITTTNGVLTAGAFGTGATDFCAGNDTRLGNARTPTAHASTHASGQADAIKLDDLAAPDDNTDLNATTSAHGLVVKATAPAAGLLNAVGIANGETGYSMKGVEPALGNPGTTGYVLSSTTAGARSWVPQNTGGEWGGDIADIDLDGGADIGEALADGDTFLGRNASGSANVVIAASRVKLHANTSPTLRDAGELVKAHGTLSGNATIDLKDGHVHTVTADAARTLTLENTTEHTAGSLTVLLTKSAHTITWGGDFSNTTGWIGTPPDISAADTYIIFFHWLGAQNVCYAVYGGTN